MLNRDRKNIWIREKTKIIDLIERVRRIRDNHIVTWEPYEEEQSRGRPTR